MNLSDKEFKYLKDMKKEFIEDWDILLSEPKRTRQITSTDKKEKFLLDYKKWNISCKYTYNKRWRNDMVLFRYDIWVPHTNPDWVRLNWPHIHIFKEWFSMKYAYPASDFWILDTDTIENVLLKIFKQRNIVNTPTIKISLF